MSAAQALMAARAAGIRLDRVSIVLEADNPPPPQVLDMLGEDRARLADGAWSGEGGMGEVKRGGFQKGRAKTGGRKMGVPNKSIVALRGAMLQAATEAGGKDALVGYLTAIARERPRLFLTLLGKMLPRGRSRRRAKTPPT